MTDITRLHPTPGEDGEKGKGGRPRLQIDTDMLRKLAELQCSYPEMAYVLGCHRDTLRNNYKDIIEEGKSKGKIKLRRAMFRNATENHHAAVQIFLAKNLLGMSDNPNDVDDDDILPWDMSDKD